MGFRRTVAEKTAQILAPLENRAVLATVLALDVLLIATWGTLFYRHASPRAAYAEQMQTALNKLTTVEQKYNLALVRGQVELSDVSGQLQTLTEQMQQTLPQVQSGQKYFAQDGSFRANAQSYLQITQHRTDVWPQIKDSHRDLARLSALVNDQLTKISANIQQYDPTLAVMLEKMVRQLTENRLNTSGQSRDKIFDYMSTVFQRVDNIPTAEQGKVYLLLDAAKQTAERLRVLDLLRQSFNSDTAVKNLAAMTDAVQDIRQQQTSDITLQFIIMVLIGSLIVALQTILALWVLAKRGQLKHLQDEASHIIAHSEAMMARARQYTQETHRTQFQMLSGFCNDFHHLTKDTAASAQHLRHNAIGTNLQYSSQNLAATVHALEKWLENYILIHQSHVDDDESASNTTNTHEVAIQTVCEKIFAEVRYYGNGVDHKSGLNFAENFPETILSTLHNVDALLRNALLIALKWANDDGLRLEVSIQKNADHQHVVLRFIDTNSQVNAQIRQTYLQIENSQQSWDGLDRFVIIAFGFCRRMLEPVGGDIGLHHHNGNSYLQVLLPYSSLEANTSGDESLDSALDVEDEENLLFKKRLLVVSPYEPTRSALQQQLTHLGATVHVIADKYSAVGQILDYADHYDKAFHGIIFEHNPPEIDAVELVTKLRSVLPHTPLPVLLMTGQNHFENLTKQNTELYDAVLLKPVLPTELKTALLQAMQPKIDPMANMTDSMDAPLDETEGLKVILFEPDDLQQIIMQASLQEKNHTIVVANNEAEALTLLKERPFDILLLSENLRDYTINLFMSIVRDDESLNRAIAVVVLASSELTDREMRRCKADDMLITPINRQTLIDKVEEWRDPTERRAAGGVRGLKAS